MQGYRYIIVHSKVVDPETHGSVFIELLDPDLGVITLSSVLRIRIDLNADPDPEFQLKTDSNSVPDPGI